VRIHERYYYIGAILAVLLIQLLLPGCAMLPMPLQPSERSSQYQEAVWQALDTVDTAQTVQIARHPVCYFEGDPLARLMYGGPHPSESKVIAVNALMAGVHSFVSSWLDVQVARESVEHPDSMRAWKIARQTWYVVSFVYSGAAVARNFREGIRPSGTRCPI